MERKSNYQPPHQRRRPPPQSSSSSSFSSSSTRYSPAACATNNAAGGNDVPDWRTGRRGRRRPNSGGGVDTQKKEEEAIGSGVDGGGNHRLQKQQQQQGGGGGGDQSSDFPTLIGTCPFMCPGSERVQRERLRDLAVFERLHGNPGKTSTSLAVKKFCRTISSKHVQASDVRPLPVLEDTLTYLLNLLDSTDHPFEVVHDFIFDRTRAIRQDVSMQNIINDKAISMYEKMVRLSEPKDTHLYALSVEFHVISHLKLRQCNNNPNISSVHYLNMEQLTKALTSLYNLYDANRDSNSMYENEAEFRSFYVLLHLDSRNQATGESLSLWFRHVPYSVIQSREMHFARSILRYLRIGNYNRFFCTIAAEASYLQYCVIEPYINQVRAQYLSCINAVGYKLHPFPLVFLSKLLLLKESDAERFCHACCLEIRTDEAGAKLLPTKQTTFCHPKGGFQSYNLLGLERFER